MDVFANLKRAGKEVILAVCDDDLLGKTLHEGQITFEVKEDFYNGGKVSVEEAICMIETSTIINLVGKNCVELAIQKGLVHPEAILTIQGIPHAQIIKM